MCQGPQMGNLASPLGKHKKAFFLILLGSYRKDYALESMFFFLICLLCFSKACVGPWVILKLMLKKIKATYIDY